MGLTWGRSLSFSGNGNDACGWESLWLGHDEMLWSITDAQANAKRGILWTSALVSVYENGGKKPQTHFRHEGGVRDGGMVGLLKSERRGCATIGWCTTKPEDFSFKPFKPKLQKGDIFCLSCFRVHERLLFFNPKVCFMVYIYIDDILFS